MDRDLQLQMAIMMIRDVGKYGPITGPLIDGALYGLTEEESRFVHLLRQVALIDHKHHEAVDVFFNTRLLPRWQFNYQGHGQEVERTNAYYWVKSVHGVRILTFADIYGCRDAHFRDEPEFKMMLSDLNKALVIHQLPEVAQTSEKNHPLWNKRVLRFLKDRIETYWHSKSYPTK